MKFKTIAIAGMPRNGNLQTHWAVYHWLLAQGFKVLLEQSLGDALGLKGVDFQYIGEHSEVVVVIGGDGNMLGVARQLCNTQILLIGINRGNLGFLTEITPARALEKLSQLLIAGEFSIEERFLLNIEVRNNRGELKSSHLAMNEAVIKCKRAAKFMDYEVYIDHDFAFSQRSDGLIIATPTGSTAYSLSAGGPILTPAMNALVLVFMYPHSLSSRPLVIDGNSTITLKPSLNQKQKLFEAVCDSHICLPFELDDVVMIKKSCERVKLLHLSDYNYFATLSGKLGWLNKKF